jgi:ADP-ribose pyrophosphatase
MSESAPQEGPTIVFRRESTLSPWVGLVEKQVKLPWEGVAETYHSLRIHDYVAILAQTPSGLIPLVRQYRPAVEGFTLELPGGLSDRGELPEQTCRRELLEETGLVAVNVAYLGAYYPDTGRLENVQHGFFVDASEPEDRFVPEPGMSVEYVTIPELLSLIKTGEMRHLLHIALVLLSQLRQDAVSPSCR